MANFYLQPVNDPTILYELHATTDIKASFQSTVTTYPIETGSDVSDNVVMSPATVSFTGVLTDVKQSGSFLSLSFIKDAITQTLPDVQIPYFDYINELRQRQFAKELFYVYISGDNAGEIEDIELAIITDFSINKDTSLGQSWSVDISLQEVRLASRAQLEAQPAVDYSELTAANTQGSGNTGGVDAAEDNQIREGLFTKSNLSKQTIKFQNPIDAIQF